MKRIGALLICLCFLLSGCETKKAQEAPKLLEPKSFEEIYEPVTRGDVGVAGTGQKKVVRGVIAPNTYCQFFQESTVIDEILVEIGDEVHVGDVLATVDVEKVQQQKDAILREIAYYNRLSELEEAKYGYEYAASVLKREEEYEEGKTPGELSENHRFEIAKNNFEIRYLGEALAKVNKSIGKTQLVANHDGIVTYVRNMGESNNVSGQDNIVIIADYEDTYIALDGVGEELKLFEQYDYTYALIGGEKYPIQKLPYSEQENMVMQGKHLFANQKAVFSGKKPDVQLGDNMDLVFQKKLHEDVLRVKNDAVFRDENGYFVFVGSKEENEKRYVQIDWSDNKYTEITEGLCEGECVKREVNPLTEKDDEKQSGIVYKAILEWTALDCIPIRHMAEEGGIVSTILFEAKDEVKQGDVVCKVKSPVGKSAATAIQNEKKDLDAEHEETQKQLNKARNAVNASINELREKMKTEFEDEKTELVMEESVIDKKKQKRQERLQKKKLAEMQANYEECNRNLGILTNEGNALSMEEQIEQHDYAFMSQELSYQYNDVMKNRSSDGQILVKAKADGKITEMNVREGTTIDEVTNAFTVGMPGRKRVRVFCKEALYPNQVVKFNDGEKRYEGKVIGIASQSKPQQYVTTIDDMVYITSNSSLDPVDSYYVIMEDDFWQQEELHRFSCEIPVFLSYEEQE